MDGWGLKGVHEWLGLEFFRFSGNGTLVTVEEQRPWKKLAIVETMREGWVTRGVFG